VIEQEAKKTLSGGFQNLPVSELDACLPISISYRILYLLLRIMAAKNVAYDEQRKLFWSLPASNKYQPQNGLDFLDPNQNASWQRIRLKTSKIP